MIKEVCSITKRGSFNLIKFNSNSPKVIESIPEEKSPANLKHIVDGSEVTRALGVKWDLLKDSFIFFSSKNDSSIPTKRNILKITSTVFDPLGFLSPFILNAKLITQDLWTINYEWDDPPGKQTEK